MTKAIGIAKEQVALWRRLPWKRLLSGLLAVTLLAWLLSDEEIGEMWRVVRGVNPWLLVAAPPVIFVNMLLRAVRWRPLLGSREETRFTSVFSALMIGYLANTILPARAGDLVRVYILGNEGTLSRSRILATVVLERMLDMAAIVFALALIAIVSPLPDWMQYGAVVLAMATIVGIAGLLLTGFVGESLVAMLLHPVEDWAPQLARRLMHWAREFVVGVQRFRSPGVALIFFSATAGIWVLEIALIMMIAHAFGLALVVIDATVLMMFSLFSSLIPALPGQIGTFELAMVTGLEFLTQNGPFGLPFAFTLHFLLLACTALIGFICLFYSGLPLLPRRLVKRLDEDT